MKVEKICKTTVTYSWSEFFAFLEQHKAFFKYLQNLKNHYNNTGKDILEYMQNTPPRSWLSSAFLWSMTPEGHDFWNVLDAYWKADVREAELAVNGLENVEWILLK